MDSCTTQEIIDTMNLLSSDPEARKQTEEEIRSKLPEILRLLCLYPQKSKRLK